MIKKSKIPIILFALLLFELIFALFWGSKKEGYYIDEPWSYGLANSYYQPFLQNDDTYMKQWQEPDFYYDYVVVNEGEAFSYDSVIYNQANDVHPPFYYMLLHTICSFFVGTYSKWFGLVLNLVFYIGTTLLLYAVTKEFIKEKSFMVYIPALLYSACAGGISTYLYIRMYMMLTFWGVLFLYLVLRMMNNHTVKPWSYMLLCLCTIAGTLTQYYFLIYAFFISATYCIWRMFRKEFKEFFLYGLSVCGGIGVSYLLFPYMLNHIFLGDKGQEVLSSASGGIYDWFKRMWEYMQLIGEELFGSTGVLLIFLIIACLSLLILLYYLIRHKQAISVKLLSIYVLIAGYFSVISLVSNEVADRYQSMLFPIIVLGFWITLYDALKLLKKEKFVWIGVILYLITIPIQYKSGAIHYLGLGYDNALNYVSTQLKEVPGIYVTKGDHLVINNLFFLGQQQNTYSIDKENIEVLPTLLENKKMDKLVLYVDIYYDEYETAKKVAEMLAYDEVTLLYDNTFTQIYVLE